MAMASSAPACAASELVAKGRESAAVLQALLAGQQPAVGAVVETPHGLQELTEQILRCCDRALAALRSGTAEGAAASGGTRKRKPERGYGPAAPPATSSKRTRLYFRCTYKDDHGCTARRQVQRSDADPSVFLITYLGDHTCCRGDDEPLAPFVIINFGSSSSDGLPSRSSPWPSCDDDGPGPVVCKSPDLCNSPEEELRSGMDNESSSEFIDQSTPVPEPTSMSPMDGCLLDWTLCDEESSFDIGEFVGQDYFDYFGLL
ncbi:hypothetical protein PVAP13_J683232 [Panicum virgatum]|nr:hypothetical protein PVAP13_J683232 [Panicum virgatum]